MWIGPVSGMTHAWHPSERRRLPCFAAFPRFVCCGCNGEFHSNMDALSAWTSNRCHRCRCLRGRRFLRCRTSSARPTEPLKHRLPRNVGADGIDFPIRARSPQFWNEILSAPRSGLAAPSRPIFSGCPVKLASKSFPMMVSGLRCVDAGLRDVGHSSIQSEAHTHYRDAACRPEIRRRRAAAWRATRETMLQTPPSGADLDGLPSAVGSVEVERRCATEWMLFLCVEQRSRKQSASITNVLLFRKTADRASSSHPGRP